MMSLFTFLLFSAALTASIWAIVATVAPKLPLIAHLLRHGPILASELPAQPRSTVRGASIRVSASGLRSAGLRAAA
jgi:hypothetical protein